MRIVILTLGTHGDVRPYVALGVGLTARGHNVLICAPENFESFITSHNLEFASLGQDFETLIKSKEFSDSLQGGILRNMPKLIKSFKPMFIAALHNGLKAAQGADMILIHPKCLFGIDIAEKLDIPVISTALQPITPTSEFPILIPRKFGALLNRASYFLLYAYSLIYGGIINEFRVSTLGLKKRSRLKHPLYSRSQPFLSLNAFSRHLVPKPADWPANAHVTGFWFLDDAPDRLTPEIEDFLATGEPPLYIGFGSMPWDSDATTDKIFAALKLWGGRAIIAKGWGGMKDINSDNVLMIEHAPHNLLLPRMQAVVHHGGAGSIAAGLRAGKPTLVCPVIADQPFWGARIAKLKCGPSPVKLKKTSAEQLAQTFTRLCTDEIYAINAKEMANKINQEDGIKTAIDLIEELSSA